MKVSRIISVFVMVALFALGSASAKDRGASSNDYLALGDSVAFGYIDQAPRLFCANPSAHKADGTSLATQCVPIAAAAPIASYAVAGVYGAQELVAPPDRNE